MKFIFDNEAHKEMILEALSDSCLCPDSVGLDDHGCDGNYGNDCLECWKNCGIKMEVKDE